MTETQAIIALCQNRTGRVLEIGGHTGLGVSFDREGHPDILGDWNTAGKIGEYDLIVGANVIYWHDDGLLSFAYQNLCRDGVVIFSSFISHSFVKFVRSARESGLWKIITHPRYGAVELRKM